jgi:hypothetical protein
VPESYVVVTENGIHNFEPSTNTDEGKAREYVASLVLCNWVLYRVEGGVYTEVDAGGIGLARPSIRWYVENELARRALCFALQGDQRGVERALEECELVRDDAGHGARG